MFTEKGLARAAHDKVNLALPNPCDPSATFRLLENGVTEMVRRLNFTLVWRIL